MKKTDLHKKKVSSDVYAVPGHQSCSGTYDSQRGMATDETGLQGLVKEYLPVSSPRLLTSLFVPHPHNFM